MRSSEVIFFILFAGLLMFGVSKAIDANTARLHPHVQQECPK